jgi:peptide/nickel transport system substrate-binding protein
MAGGTKSHGSHQKEVRQRVDRLNIPLVGLLLALIVTACATPAPAPAQPPGSSGSSGAVAAPEPPRQRKAIVVASGRVLAPPSLPFLQQDTELSDMVHAGLARMNSATYQLDPWMAEELPSIEKGTWKINPDGSMETTYRLRPGIRWHDGTPFSPQDFAFGREVQADRKVPPYQYRRQAEYIDRIEAPDDRTMVVHWNTTYRLANALIRTELYPLPRHLLEATYRAGDYERFNNDPWWITEFVGIGPYRVTSIEHGVAVQLEAFDGYFLGRPKIDSVTWRHIADAQVTLTNLLADAIDVTVRDALVFDSGISARDQWEKRGAGQVFITPSSWRWININAAHPWANDVRVKRALLHAVDREAIAQSLSYGYDRVIEAPMSPFRPQYARVDAAVTKHEFNPSRAQAILEEAGWRKAADGVLVNAQGDRFSIDGRTRSDQQDRVQEQAVTIPYWKAVGVEVTVNNLTSAQYATEDNRNRWPGAFWNGHNLVVEEWLNRFGNAATPSDSTRWVGDNVSRWSSPRKEAILREMDQSLDRQRWEDLSVEFAVLFSQELPHLSMMTSSAIMAIKNGVTGVQAVSESGVSNSRTWNVEQWDKR